MQEFRRVGRAKLRLGRYELTSPVSTGDWSVGVLECWSVGVLECWSVGVLECWSVGVLLKNSFESQSRFLNSFTPVRLFPDSATPELLQLLSY
jgi:hypothetical protein